MPFGPARVSPIWAAARVPLSNPQRPWNFSAGRGPQGLGLSRQPTGVWPAAAGALAGAEAKAAVAAARAARRAALKTYRKFSQTRDTACVLCRVMLDISPP